MLLAGSIVQAAKISDVRATKHNLSAAADGSATPSGTVPIRNIKATSESQVCVFCHTPHAAENIPKVGGTPGAPLWNRKLSSATYTPYSSTSIEASAAEMSAAPGGSSKLCLSCHDGTMGIDKVNVLNGASNPSIPMKIGGTSTSPAYMPSGSGATTGYTRNLGANLSNDHPISFTYNNSLAVADGELRTPAAQNTPGGVVMNRGIGMAKPVLPLENNQLQCMTCHDPHLNDTVDDKAKFLRVNRLQAAQPLGSNFSQPNDIICLACHDRGGVSWAYSAHANSSVATQTYKAAEATMREFPTNTPVWKAACLNCHDTHTVQGARRLLRDGTDGSGSPKAGGNAALEETCYQCHTTSAGSAVTYTADTSNAIPDIKTDFSLSRRMPIKSSDQPAGVEVHEIGGIFNDGANANCNNTAGSGQCGKDLLESRVKLGALDLSNRHAECSDCHNPHRVVKFRDFRGASGSGNIVGSPDAAGTHPHTDNVMSPIHSNIASGVLRGTTGVEPVYSSASFHLKPVTFDVKRGDPGTSINTAASATYVTREYQICLKCHSDYGFTDNNVYPLGNRPTLGSFTGGTPSGSNGLTMYTNQAKEFQAPSAHATEPASLGTAAGSSDTNYNTNNHRGWHPVMGPTGRTLAKRGITNGSPFLAPWDGSSTVGAQTMYCTDCHGSGVTSATSVIPDGGDNGKPWGPHGSNNDFLLKGTWVDKTAGDSNLLCFKCHEKDNFSSGGFGGGGWTGSGSSKSSGFSGGSNNNLHSLHANRVGTLRCTWCHVAVPHGWKNKQLLVNLNDVSEEAGQGVGSSKEVAISGSSNVYSQQPYYYKAKLKIRSFATSGNWDESNCGSAGKSGTGLTTGLIAGSGGTSNTTGSGQGWMRATCSNPP